MDSLQFKVRRVLAHNIIRVRTLQASYLFFSNRFYDIVDSKLKGIFFFSFEFEDRDTLRGEWIDVLEMI